ncbi:hypothetical protein RJ639_010265 [Escallonia herrerae]|uniref:Integrase catalytic domain-containing protein n=1 Tax=Escallonia herrerae TaxID=1293975 RepID=A0AA89AU32_9ASTE|nr:hypothetical protein RJ639_010265 [Escallonia herrerae]
MGYLADRPKQVESESVYISSQDEVPHVTWSWRGQSLAVFSIPFAIWVMDILEPFAIASRQRRFVIVAIDYFTKWSEAEALAITALAKCKDFSWKNVLCRFKVPRPLIVDNRKQFDSTTFRTFCENLLINRYFTFVAHPLPNGQTESINQNILNDIMYKILLGDVTVRHPHVNLPGRPPRLKDGIFIIGNPFNNLRMRIKEANFRPLWSKGHFNGGLFLDGLVVHAPSLSSPSESWIHHSFLLSSPGEILAAIRRLDSLQVLELQGNNFPDAVPRQLRIDPFEAEVNHIVGSIPPEIGSLKKLKRLKLSKNRLSGSLLDQLEELKELKRILLGENNLTGSIPAKFSQLTSLVVLDLSQNDLTGHIPVTLANDAGLKILLLNHNRLSGRYLHHSQTFAQILRYVGRKEPKEAVRWDVGIKAVSDATKMEEILAEHNEDM